MKKLRYEADPQHLLVFTEDETTLQVCGGGEFEVSEETYQLLRSNPHIQVIDITETPAPKPKQSAKSGTKEEK